MLVFRKIIPRRSMTCARGVFQKEIMLVFSPPGKETMRKNEVRRKELDDFLRTRCARLQQVSERVLESLSSWASKRKPISFSWPVKRFLQAASPQKKWCVSCSSGSFLRMVSLRWFFNTIALPLSDLPASGFSEDRVPRNSPTFGDVLVLGE